MDPIILRVYIITAAAGIAAAVLLVKLSKSSVAANVKTPKNASEEETEDLELTHMIYGTVSNIIASERISKEITKGLTNVISKELNKKTKSNLDFMEKKYQPFIKNAEIAWSRYAAALTSQKKVEAVMHSIASGYIVLDSGGRIVMANPAAEDILGVPRDRIIDSTMADILKEGRSVSLLDRNNVYGMKVDRFGKDIETNNLLRNSNAIIEDHKGQTVGIVSILNDLTKQRKLDEMKREFIANVTHELRAPIIAAEKAINMIQNTGASEASPEAHEQYLAMAMRNLKRLKLLVDDLLDLSKIESGMARLNPSAASVEKIIDDSIQDIQAWVMSKSIRIEKVLHGNIPEANMDAKKISQVLNNLIGNAVKFTPENGVITVKAGLSADDGKRITISVEDTGAGIEEGKIDKIFDRFYQASERTPIDITGTGIGLSLAKENVELHGGKIWAENKKDKGARFTFELPLVTGGRQV
ncbi:MAG: ATP-binding protein [Candidatus Omnitrophota bacterium]